MLERGMNLCAFLIDSLKDLALTWTGFNQITETNYQKSDCHDLGCDVMMGWMAIQWSVWGIHFDGPTTAVV
jgi:hypothetical protein